MFLFSCCCTEEQNHETIDGAAVNPKGLQSKVDVFNERKEELNVVEAVAPGSDAAFGDTEDEAEMSLLPTDGSRAPGEPSYGQTDTQPEPEASYEVGSRAPGQNQNSARGSLEEARQVVEGSDDVGEPKVPPDPTGPVPGPGASKWILDMQTNFTAVLDKPGKIGLNVRHHNATMLEILTIKDGLIKEYNQKIAEGEIEGTVVLVGDVIHTVNGETGSASSLLRTIADSGRKRLGDHVKLELGFVRGLRSRHPSS